MAEREEAQSLLPSEDEDPLPATAMKSSKKSSYTQQQKDDAAKMQEIMDAMKPETLDFTLTCGAYDAIVAAAFGGVHITSSLSDDDGNTRRVRIHPSIIFFVNSMLFTVQLTILSSLVLDMKLRNIYCNKDGSCDEDDTSWDGFDTSPTRQMNLVVKTMMVVLLQIMTLKEMLGALRPLLMVVNPVTWFELHRGEEIFDELTGGREADNNSIRGISCLLCESLFEAWLCVPLCIVSQLMQFSISYYVLNISMSIVLSADTPSHMIFNALAVTFLQDLDEHVFTALARVFHIDIQEVQEFKLKIRRDKEVKEAQQKAVDSWKAWVESWKPGGTSTRGSSLRSCFEPFAIWFYHGRGGKAKLVQNLVTVCLLTTIYIRQLFIYCQSVTTGILPVARDFCATYRGLERPEDHPFQKVMVIILDVSTWIDYPVMLRKHIIEQLHSGEACFEDIFRRDPFDELQDYLSWYPRPMWLGVISILLVMIVPQTILANFELFMRPSQGPPLYRVLHKVGTAAMWSYATFITASCGLILFGVFVAAAYIYIKNMVPER